VAMVLLERPRSGSSAFAQEFDAYPHGPSVDIRRCVEFGINIASVTSHEYLAT
jgi:hypothetical protein